MMVMYLISSIGMGILFVGLCLPMAQGKIKPNALYGLRTCETQADERIWYAANRVSGRQGIAFGLLLMLQAGRLAGPLWSRPDSYINIQMVLIVVGTLVWAGLSMAAARRIHAEVKEQDQARD